MKLPDLRLEQEQDLILRNLKLHIHKQPHDEQFLKTHPRAQSYIRNFQRLHIKNESQLREYYGETVEIKYHQTLIRH